MTIQETRSAVLGNGTVAEFAEAMRGEVLRPGDDGYEAARPIWNGAHDRHPALSAARARAAGTGGAPGAGAGPASPASPAAATVWSSSCPACRPCTSTPLR